LGVKGSKANLQDTFKNVCSQVNAKMFPKIDTTLRKNNVILIYFYFIRMLIFPLR